MIPDFAPPMIAISREEYTYLKEAAEILNELWQEHGPYDRTWKVPNLLWSRILTLQDFDDSE